MLQIYLCEDEENQLLHLKKMIEQYIIKKNIDAKIVSTRMNPQQTLEDARENAGKPALFFIDVELKGYSMNGFELVRTLKKQKKDYAFVFLTSHEELAYKVFEYELGVMDYIVKSPGYFLADEMSDALAARLDRIFGEMEEISVRKKQETILLECGSRIVPVAVQDIRFIQAVKGKHMAEVWTVHSMISIRLSLKNIYEMLNEDFIYINKSCIVQKSMIQEIDRKNRTMVVAGGHQLEIAYREMKNVCSSM